MNKYSTLPSGFQLDQNVSIAFPGNATLHNCKIVKVSFTMTSQPIYDVEVPFHHMEDNPAPSWMSENSMGQHDSSYPPNTGFFRMHGVREWFIIHSKEDLDKMREKLNDFDGVFESIANATKP